jgi:hypothetical protein
MSEAGRDVPAAKEPEDPGVLHLEEAVGRRGPAHLHDPVLAPEDERVVRGHREREPAAQRQAGQRRGSACGLCDPVPTGG